MGSWPQATFIPTWASLRQWVALAPTRVYPSLNMGGLGAHFAMGLSQSGMGDTGVPGGASVLHVGNISRQPDPDEGVPTPACSYHASGFSHTSASPCSHCGSPAPSLVVGSASHPSHCSASLPSLISFSGHSGDHLVAHSSVTGYMGGVLLPHLPAHLAALVDVHLCRSTPFLLHFFIGVPSAMNPIWRNQVYSFPNQAG